ncbi:hypothetical protein R3P38DRAFT_2874451 [Favolaschia claudopus]|uniref:Uncharacterized protein n=1 Tax=Favolaschia claudopus TaxID=2862362 RepID=A0AAW0D652_9AGAR
MAASGVPPELLTPPSSKRYIIPEYGAFVGFTLDPIASLSQGAQSDPEAVELCKKLVCKQYVGIVVDREGLYMPWLPYNSCYVRLIQQGQPKGDPEQFIEPSMSVPVLPMTEDPESHVSGRTPIKPSEPLPWKDCYISIAADAVVRSPSMWTTDVPNWTIDEDQQDELHVMMVTDIRRMDLLQAQAQASRAPFTNPGAPNESSASPPAQEARDTSRTSPDLSPVGISDGVETHPRTHHGSGSDSASNSVSEPDADDEELEDDDEALFNELFGGSPSTEFALTVHFTHDLLSVKEFNDPADYYKEAKAIEKIEQDAAPRVKESRALKLKDEIKRAKEADSALYDGQTYGMLIERDSPHVARARALILQRREAEIRANAVLTPFPEILMGIKSDNVHPDTPLAALPDDVPKDSDAPYTAPSLIKEQPAVAQGTTVEEPVDASDAGKVSQVKVKHKIRGLAAGALAGIVSKLKKSSKVALRTIKRFRP